MRRILIHPGTVLDVYAVSAGGRAPFKGFFQGLDNRLKGKGMARIEFLSAHLPHSIRNDQVCKKLTDHIFELKARGQRGEVRVFFFYHEGDAVLTHGYFKKEWKTKRTEIDRAENLRRQFLSGVDD